MIEMDVWGWIQTNLLDSTLLMVFLIAVLGYLVGSIKICGLDLGTAGILLVALVFGVVFYFSDIPLYLAFLFGGIALATAPAPALSIVREFKTKGPVTSTLIPMAALDDIVGCIVFFSTVAIVAGNLSAGDLPAYMIALVVLLPLVIGVITGLLAGFVLKKERRTSATLALLILSFLPSLPSPS